MIVGIDFGTSTSAIGVMRDGIPKLLSIDGEAVMPSVVAFSKNGEVLVGAPAKKQAILNPEWTFSSVKRRLGERQTVRIDDKEWSMEEIGAQILLRLKTEAEKQLKQPVKDAVVTVPAYFNQHQRQAVQEIGRLAGLNILRIINEPTAAAMAYGLSLTEEKNVLVFDFGGGTFDVSILTIADGVFEVRATGGDNSLGGDDIDQLVIDKVVKDFAGTHHVDLSQDKMAMQKLKDEAEKLKVALSESFSARLNVPFIAADEHGPIHLDATFTVETLDGMTKGIVNRLVMLVNQTLRASGLTKNDIDHVLLAGGSTRIGAVRNAVEDNLGKKVLGGVNPMECVAVGAAVQAAILDGTVENTVLLDVTPLTLGLEIDGGGVEAVIPGNTTIPTSQKKIFTTVADNQTEVEVKVLQGNSDRAAENIVLGTFILSGLVKAKKGEAKVEVEFDVDVNGIMEVKAKDKKSGKSESITIHQSVTTRQSAVNG